MVRIVNRGAPRANLIVVDAARPIERQTIEGIDRAQPGRVLSRIEVAVVRRPIEIDHVARMRGNQYRSAELDRMRALHGSVVLWDAHSIRSVVPRFFDGRLPDFNLGTADGANCDSRMAGQVLAIARRAAGHSSVLNGRFTGGHITRHYGSPAQHVHAIQLEMAQCIYMDEQYPFDYVPALATQLQPHLRDMLEAALHFVERAAVACK